MRHIAHLGLCTPEIWGIAPTARGTLTIGVVSTVAMEMHSPETMSANLILLVEDNESDIDLTRRALERGQVPNRLVVAEDGQEALDYLGGSGSWAGRTTSELPALILLDLKLPRISGIQVLRGIRSSEKTRRLPVVILTTSREEADVGACYDLCINSYIRKPVDFNQFVQVIQELGMYWLVLNEPPPPPN